LRCIDFLDEGIDTRHHDAAHHCFEEFFLCFEVQIQQALADTGFFRDFLDPCGGIALFGECGECGLGDFLRPVLLAPLVAWLCHFWSLADQ